MAYCRSVPTSERKHRVLVSWWIGTGALSLAWLAFPLLCRAGGVPLLLLWLLEPLTLYFLLVELFLMLQTGCFSLRRLVLGCAVVAFGVAASFTFDHQVRRWLFSSSYSDYQAVAREFIASPPEPSGPTTLFDTRHCEVAGVDSGNAQCLGNRLIVSFHTPYGPSEETLLFSSKPTSYHRGDDLELVRVDDMGYWYLVLREFP